MTLLQLRTASAISLLAFLMAAGSASAQQSGGSIASSCAGCHAEQSREQEQTPMGLGLQLAKTDALFKARPVLTFEKGPYRYRVETTGSNTVYSVSDGTRTISLPVPWSFGKGAQTWILNVHSELYESMVSYYPSINGLEITTGDEALTPKNLEEAVGRKLRKSEPKDCFGCHSTNAVSDDKLDLQSMQPGVTCEHCHTGSIGHLVAASQGQGYETAPPDLRKLTSEDMSNFCGQCHRTWETVVRSRSRGEIDVRFQPYRLANSKCFDGTDPRISCIACHDPHKNLETSEAHYDAKCLACHASNGRTEVNHTHGTAKACTVAVGKCVSCHMPKVKLPNGLMTFHDHQIRVVKPGEPYPN